MNFMEFMEKTAPEDLQKLAEEAENDFANKIVDLMFPLLEKQAEYTVALVMEKLAEAGAIEQQIEETPLPASGAPASGASDNSTVEGTNTPSGLKLSEIQDAVQEAIASGSPDKIIPFVKAIEESRPEYITEVIKIVKVQLHDAAMKKTIDPEVAVQIAQALDGGAN